MIRASKKTHYAALTLVGVAFVLGGFVYAFRGQLRDGWTALTRPRVPEATPFQPAVTSTPSTAVASTTPIRKPAPTTTPTTSASSLKAEVNLKVPFLLQAPKQNWVQPYEDACEEASLIMVDAYYDGRTTNYGPDEGIRAIDEVVAFENETYGYNKDTTAAEVANTAKSFFGRNAVVLEATEASIKKALNEGHPVIVPVYGKALLNPNFRDGGPEYHMLVIKGYNKDGSWITNDPGTRNGSDYVYPKQRLLDAIHDFDPDDVRDGRKVMIIVYPE
jgi:hypothetical protein